MNTDRQPNRLLASLMEEAAISNKGLAARIKILARRDGLSISTDHVSVRRWLNGAVPRGRTPEYMARALSAKLERRVTLAEMGLSGAGGTLSGDIAGGPTRYPETFSDAVQSLSELSTKDLEDSQSVREMEWSSEVTPETISSYLFGQSNVVPDSPSDLKEPLTAAAIRGTAAHLMDLDLMYGGGYIRKLLLFFFKSEVVPVLRQPGPEKTRREVFSAAAEVAQLLGWSAYDSGRHGAAQRYFIQGLRLAREGNAHMLGGRLLSNLSHQANYLGNFGDAAKFARAAQSVVLGKSSPSVAAMFMAMEARAQASVGDERGCSAALNKAEALLAKQVSDVGPDWIRYFDAAELAGEAAHCFRDLYRPTETLRFADRAVEPTSTPARTRAFISMVKAAGVLAQGEVEEALTLALTAVDIAGALQSDRYVRYLKDFHRSLNTDTRKAVAEEFADRARSVYPEIRFAS